MTRKYCMTRSERQQAIDALTAAKQFLWDGKNSGPIVTSHICFALNKVEWHTGISTSSAKELVMRSLAGYGTYSQWLECNYQNRDWSLREVQTQRHRWVRHLISELKKSLDTPKQKK